MILIMKKTQLTKKITLECSSQQYWSVWKKNQIVTKTFYLLSRIGTLFFKLSQSLGPIQVLISNFFKNMNITI